VCVQRELLGICVICVFLWGWLMLCVFFALRGFFSRLDTLVAALFCVVGLFVVSFFVVLMSHVRM
jgi:hypothetical protein